MVRRLKAKRKFEAENEAKANFDSVYTEPTPHSYIAEMAHNGYQIGEQARPYGIAAAELLQALNGSARLIQMLDVGCSYGMGSVFTKYGCSFDELVAFFASRAPKDYASCCEVMRMWLNVAPPVCEMRSVGLDSSRPAILFALDSGLLDGGIARDYENPEIIPTQEEINWFRSCNLLVCTGAIGYVTEETFSKVLPHLGQDSSGKYGPVAVMTILRMFENEKIRDVFEEHNFEFMPVPGISLPQRNFRDNDERTKVLNILHQKGIDTEGYEDEGTLYADLYVAAPESQVDELVEQMQNVKTENDNLERLNYIRR